jgi:hypothetical protein
MKLATISIHLFSSQMDLLALFYLVSNLWTSSNHTTCLKVLELKSRVASDLLWNLWIGHCAKEGVCEEFG